MSRDVYQTYISTSLPLACILLDEKLPKHKETLEMLSALAAKFRKTVLFTYMDLYAFHD